MLSSPVFNNQESIGCTKSVSLKPPAKLNLSLVVFDRGDDGYHELHTVMASISLHDDLQIRLSEKAGIRLYCTGLPSPAGPQNLVYRAAELLASHALVQPDLDIYLNKFIPAGAGLGGGSSDAAAVLLGLNRLWDLNLQINELEKIAAELGSDVSFFLHAPVAYCSGRGQVVTKLPHRCRRPVLLIFSDVHAATKQVYQKYIYNKGAAEEDMKRMQYFLRLGNLDGLLSQNINSLAPPALELFEPLEQLKQQLIELQIRPVHLAGSGSTFFVTGDSTDQISTWAHIIKQRNLAQVQEVFFQEQTELFPEVHHADF